MKKRYFLQGITAGLVAAVVWSADTFSRIDFDTQKKYSNHFFYSGEREDLPGVIESTLADARTVLPKGTEFVLFDRGPIGNGCGDIYDDLGVVGWKYPVPPQYADLPLRAFCSEKVEGGARRTTQRMIA